MNTTLAYETEDDRWAAVQARDVAADGQFVYAVRTTGVYCQPSSTARLPKRENVEFFDSAEAAEAAGYRCSRRAPVATRPVPRPNGPRWWHAPAA